MNNLFIIGMVVIIFLILYYLVLLVATKRNWPYWIRSATILTILFVFMGYIEFYTVGTLCKSDTSSLQLCRMFFLFPFWTSSKWPATDLKSITVVIGSLIHLPIILGAIIGLLYGKIKNRNRNSPSPTL